MIKLKNLSTQEYYDNPDLFSSKFIKSIQQDRAIILDHPGFAESHEFSLKASKAFFEASDVSKNEVHGVTYFSKLHKDRIMRGELAGHLFEKDLAEVLGKERGWVASSEANSGVPKQYFQYGPEISSLRQEDVETAKRELIPNLWPSEEIFSGFKDYKSNHHKICTEIHTIVFQSIAIQMLGKEYQKTFYSGLGNIICRDTFYPPLLDESAYARETVIRNKPHMDLAEGTIIKHAHGLQIYMGKEAEREDIISDEEGWKTIDTINLTPDSIIYIPGLALEIKTNGALKGNWHRVISVPELDSSKARISIVSFGNTGINDVLEPLPQFTSDAGGKSKYPSIIRSKLPLVGNKFYLESLKYFNENC